MSVGWIYSLVLDFEVFGMGSESENLSQQWLDHFSVNVGQPHVASAESVGQTFVIYAAEMQHGGVQIIDLYTIFYSFVSVLIRSAVGRSPFYPSTRHPNGETKWIVVASVAALRKGCSAKLSGPND
jgi:hypothetical protein